MDDVDDDADDFFAPRPPVAQARPQAGQGGEPKSSRTFLFADDAVEDWPEPSGKSANAVSFVDEAVDEYPTERSTAASGVVTFVDDDLDNPNPKFRHSSAPRPAARPPKRRGGWTRMIGSIIVLLLLLAGGFMAYRTFVIGDAQPSPAPAAAPVQSEPAAAVAPAATSIGSTQSNPPTAAPIASASPSSSALSPPPAAEARKPVRATERTKSKKARPQAMATEKPVASPAPPVETVACILPSGQEVRMPYLACRARSGVIYR